MLSNSSSSIQQRRKTHRRQQSLEVPILTHNLGPRRNPPGRQHPGHRRGISLDHVGTANSPTGFQSLLPHQGPLDTNSGHQQPRQHFTQATQQQSLAQPGYQAQDFQSHLHQQLNGLTTHQPPPLPPPHIDIKPAITPPQSSHPHQHQQVALADLQQHLEWYRQQYGTSPQPTMQINPYVERAHHEMQAAQMSGAQMAGAQMPMQMMPVQSIPLQHMPQTPVSQGGARTMPNTPQNHAMAWPSPPPTQAKHVRSQSFQLDVAPMPDAMGGNVMMPMPFGQPNTFNFDSASFASDHGYASSAYSSSAVDPLSPQPQHPGHMPTLFEESTSALPGQQISGDFVGSSLMMQATAGAQDFNDPNFDFNNGPMPMSPRQQLLSTLGPEVPASIVDTGVPAWEVQQYIGELSEGDQKYPCMYPKCSRRFGRKENVRAHIQTHLGDRQFRCNLCDKTFVRQHDLKRHVAIHSDDRPFVCACMTGFARHDALTRHRQRGMCVGALPGYEKSEEEKPKRGRPKKERPDMETRVDKASRQRKKNKERAAEAGGDDQESDQQQIVYASSSSGGSDRSFPVTPPDTSDAFDTDAFLNMANGDTQYNNMTSAWRETPPTSPFISSPTKTVDSVDPTNTSNQPFNFDLPLNQHQGISPAMLSARDSPCPANNMPAGSTPDGHRDVFSYGSPSGEPSFHGGSSPTEANDLWDGTLPDHPNVVNGGNSNFNAFSPPGDSHCSSSTYNYSMYHESLDNGGFLGGKNFTSGGGVIMTNGNFDDDMLAMPSSADQERSLSNMLDDWLASH